MPVSSDEIVISGVGMASCLGFDAVTSCASARAGISRSDELDDFGVFSPGVDPFSNVEVIGMPIRGITEGYSGMGRLVRMAALALEDLLEVGDVLLDRNTRIGLYVNLSSAYYEDQAQIRYSESLNEGEEKAKSKSEDEENELRSNSRQSEWSDAIGPSIINAARSEIRIVENQEWYGDHPGFIELIERASMALQERKLDACVVGGVDSFLGRETLNAVAACNILKTPDMADGIIPGEASAFVLLERRETVVRRGERVLAILESAASVRGDIERFSHEPLGGVALADAIRGAFEGRRQQHAVKLIIAGLNGDPHVAHEWGMALIRLPNVLRDLPLWVPAVSFGETGAASAAMAMVMTVRAFARSYSGGGQVLVWASGPRGSKGAAVLSRS